MALDVGSDGVDQLRDHICEILNSLKDASLVGSHDRLKDRRFDIDSPPPEEPPILWVGDAEVCHAGNLTSIEAQIKSGKSSFVSALLASIIGQQGIDYLGCRSDGNPRKLALVHFDTEQSRGHHHKLILRALSRARLDRPPSYFYSYLFTGLGYAEMRQLLEVSLERAATAHGGIHSVFIDGLADMVVSPNDDIGAFKFVRDLQEFALEFSCPIIGVLHLNPAAEGDFSKSRGHLGSELNRKAESVIRLMKDKDEVTTIDTKEVRGAKNAKGREPRFAWSDEHDRHMLVASKTEVRRAEKIEALGKIIRAVWLDSPNGAIRHDDVIQGIMCFTGKKESTAKTRLGEMQSQDLVIKQPDGAGYAVTIKGQFAFDPEEPL
jgi:hypothetical protein